MATLARLFDFMPGDVIRSADVDSEFNQIINLVNGTSTTIQTVLQLQDNALATLKLNQVTATAGASILSLNANGVEKVKVDGTGRIHSTVSTGTAPLVIASTTLVTNLNADLLDGLHANQIGTVITTLGDVTTGDIIISNADPRLTFLDTTASAEDCYLELDTDGTDQQLSLRRSSDNQRIQRWNITRGTSQFHNVAVLRNDAGGHVDITVSVGGSDPLQHLTTKKYVDEAILAGGGGATIELPTYAQHLAYVPAGGTLVVADEFLGGGISVVGASSTAVHDAAGRWARQTSNAALNNRASAISTQDQYKTGWGGEVQAKLRWNTITANRMMFGITSTDLTDDTVPNPTTGHYAFITYDDSVHGTAFFRCYSRDGTTIQTTVTTTAVTAGTVYRMKIKSVNNGASLKFYINDNLVATHATNVPGTNTYLGVQWSSKTTDTNAKTTECSWVQAFF